MPWLFDFAPVAGAALIEYEVDAVNPLLLRVNGEPHDFSALLVNEGDLYDAAAIPGASTWLRSTEVTLWEGKVRLCVVTPKAADSAPASIRHPGPKLVASGRVTHPIEELT